MTFGAGAVWVTTLDSLVRIDPARDVVRARVLLPEIAGAAAVDGRYVWVLTNPIHTRPTSVSPSLLWSVDTSTNRVVGKPIPLSPMAQGGQIAVAGGSLWIANDNHGRFGRVYRIDPVTRRVVAAVHIPDDPASVVLAYGSLWVGESDTGRVVRIDPKSGAIEGRPIAVGGALLTLTAAGDDVWVANSYSGRIVTINARTGHVTASRPLAGVSWITAARGTVWTTRNGELVGFNAASGHQTFAPTRIPGGTDRVEAHGIYVWVLTSRGVIRVSA